MSTTTTRHPAALAAVPLTAATAAALGARAGRRSSPLAAAALLRAAARLGPGRRGRRSPAWSSSSRCPLWSRVVEGRRGATDRLVTALVWAAFALALVPLVSLLWTVVDQRAAPRSTSTFLTYSMCRTVLDQAVGIYHALIGTLLITLCAAIISVPIGIFAAIYLVEYGKGNRLARLDHLPRRRHDRHPVDRRRPVRLRAVRS